MGFFLLKSIIKIYNQYLSEQNESLFITLLSGIEAR